MLRKLVIFTFSIILLCGCSAEGKEPHGVYVRKIPSKNIITTYDFRNNGVVYLEITNIVPYDEQPTQYDISGNTIKESLMGLAIREKRKEDHEDLTGDAELSWIIDSYGSVELSFKSKVIVRLDFDGNDLVSGRTRLVKQ